MIFIWKSAIFLGEQWFNNGLTLTMVNDCLSGGLSGGLYIYIHTISRYLVGGAVTILKNILECGKMGKDDPINMKWKVIIQPCSKAPTSDYPMHGRIFP